jgi:hypothetical protein
VTVSLNREIIIETRETRKFKCCGEIFIIAFNYEEKFFEKASNWFTTKYSHIFCRVSTPRSAAPSGGFNSGHGSSSSALTPRSDFGSHSRVDGHCFRRLGFKVILILIIIIIIIAF